MTLSHTRSACEYTVYVFLFSNTASRVRIEITGLQVEGQVTTRVRDDSNTGASLWQPGQRHLVSFLLWNTHVDNTRVQIWSSCMSLICCSICYMYFRFCWTMPSARGPRRIMAHFKKRREYMSQVIHYTNRQCKLVQHTNIDINRYGDWGLPSVRQLRTHLEIVTSISLSSRYRFAEQMYQKQSSSVSFFSLFLFFFLFTSWNKTLPSSPNRCCWSTWSPPINETTKRPLDRKRPSSHLCSYAKSSWYQNALVRRSNNEHPTPWLLQ